jgi:hypothetical protein
MSVRRDVIVISGRASERWRCRVIAITVSGS